MLTPMHKRKRGGETVLSHVWGAWREVDQGKEFCLHLAEPKWINMFRKLIRYIGTTSNSRNKEQRQNTSLNTREEVLSARKVIRHCGEKKEQVIAYIGSLRDRK